MLLPDPRPTAAPAFQPLPGPRGLPVLGSTLDLLREGPLPCFERAWRRYGDAFSVVTPGRRLVVLVHPDMVQHVLRTNRQNYIKGTLYDEFRKLGGTGLVSSEGERWRRDRALAQPAFHRKQIAALAGLMAQSTDRVLDELAAAPEQEVDLSFVMMRLALIVMGHALFDQDLADAAGATGPAMTKALSLLVARSNEPFTLPVAWPTPQNRALKAALGTLREAVQDVLARHREAPADDDRALLLKMLLSARDEAGAGFTEEELYDQLLTLFVAGHETTALTLTWCLDLLHRHPAVRARLEAEVLGVLGDRPPGLADLAQLPYTRQVLEETMRVRPALWSVGRNAVEDDVVCGFRVPAGAWVVTPMYLTHRHPDFWVDPEQFDPDRFSSEASAHRHPCAWLPFSAGPRRCIGDSFAMLEMTIALARIAQRGHFVRSDDDPLGFDAQLSLRPDRPVRARMRWR